jgi:hypothetical protein
MGWLLMLIFAAAIFLALWRFAGSTGRACSCSRRLC